MTNDVQIDASKFDPASIPAETHALNQSLMDIMAKGPKWYEVGAEKYRQMRARGETPIPAAILLDSAESFSIPSRDENRLIPARIFKPQKGARSSSNSGNRPIDAGIGSDDNIGIPGHITGVFMHIHGGGWVLQDEKSQDGYLQSVSDSNDLLVISIGYRLAPENPFPAAPNDCYDAAEWLVLNAQSKFGVPLSFIGGESAGGHLAALTTLHLLQHLDPRFSSSENFNLRGLLLHFGCFDLNFTPSVYNFVKPTCLILDRDIMEHYIDAFLPGMTHAEIRDPKVSPLYADLENLRGRLPPALFTCGTEDPLLDDTVFMSTRWAAAGAETVVNILPGGAHGYIMFSEDTPGSQSRQGLKAVKEFIKRN